MQDFSKEFIAFISKVWVWLLYILIGLLAKFSYDYMAGKRITWIQALCTTFLALFIGYLSAVYCINHNMEKEGMWIVPICTLISDKIVLSIIAFDYKDTVRDWLKYWIDKLKP